MTTFDNITLFVAMAIAVVGAAIYQPIILLGAAVSAIIMYGAFYGIVGTLMVLIKLFRLLQR